MYKILSIITVLVVISLFSLNAQEAVKRTLGGSNTQQEQTTETQKTTETEKRTLGGETKTTTTTTSTTTTTAATQGKTIKGQVISLNDYMRDGKGVVSQARAKELVAANQPIVFKSGGKIYFVFNEDGSFASSKLVNYVNAPNVGIVGKTQTRNGINIIIASMMQAM